MKPKREVIPTLTLAQNFRLIMTLEGLTFRELAAKSNVSLDTAYRLAERKSPKFVTGPVLRVGKALGFTRRQIEAKMRQDRLATGRVFSKKEALFKLIAELLEVYDLK